jgi:hypothetical protein
VSEFDEWQAYFEERLTFSEKADYYTASMIRAIYASQGAKVGPIKDFLLELKPATNTKPPEEGSKDTWLRIFGMNTEDQ